MIDKKEILEKHLLTIYNSKEEMDDNLCNHYKEIYDAMEEYKNQKEEEEVTIPDIPLMIGTLNKAQGIIGYKKADIGHPVFEAKDRFLIYLESNDGKITLTIPYYKGSLKPFIDFNLIQ